VVKNTGKDPSQKEKDRPEGPDQEKEQGGPHVKTKQLEKGERRKGRNKNWGKSTVWGGKTLPGRINSIEGRGTRQVRRDKGDKFQGGKGTPD